MAAWRMKLRDGSHGEDMWPSCGSNRVAGITYNGIESVNLKEYSRKLHPPGWQDVGGGKGSLSHFAWDICGGDTIYVGDSKSHEIVGRGYVTAPIGELAYYFDEGSPIVTETGKRWCHLVRVDWEATFKPFPYKDRQPIITVLELNNAEVAHYERESRLQEHHSRGYTPDEAQDLYLLESYYARNTPATIRLIHRKHVILSKQFRSWLNQQSDTAVRQERAQIDATFENNGKRFLVEFKIAYAGDTKAAIREALGQILEYNHYPPRISHDIWLLILDTAPSEQDKAFIEALSEKFKLPIHLGWRAGADFYFSPETHFKDPGSD